MTGPATAQKVMPDITLPPRTPTPCSVKTVPASARANPVPTSTTRFMVPHFPGIEVQRGLTVVTGTTVRRGRISSGRSGGEDLRHSSRLTLNHVPNGATVQPRSGRTSPRPGCGLPRGARRAAVPAGAGHAARRAGREEVSDAKTTVELR